MPVNGETPTASPVTIIKAGRLIDGRGGEPIAHAMVRVEGEKIAEVGGNLSIPTNAKVIDLGEATLLPGLIDLHTHLTGKMGVHWEDALTKTTPGHDALWGARNARVTLLAGFTTCREMGPTWPYVDVDLRNAIDEGAVPGPRLLVAGNYVSSTGGAGDAKQFSIYVDVPTVKNLADGPEEVTKAVRTNFKNGADFIKIMATGAVLSKGIKPGAQQYSDAEIQAAVTEANRWGKQVAAHAHGAAGIKAAIRAGVRTVDHGSELDDEAIALIKASNRKTFYVPTLDVLDAVEQNGAKNNIPESERERGRQIHETMTASFQTRARGQDSNWIGNRCRGDRTRRELARVRSATSARRIDRRDHCFGDKHQCGNHWLERSRRKRRSGKVCGPDRGARRSAEGCYAVSPRRLRDERRRDLSR